MKEDLTFVVTAGEVVPTSLEIDGHEHAISSPVAPRGCPPRLGSLTERQSRVERKAAFLFGSSSPRDLTVMKRDLNATSALGTTMTTTTKTLGADLLQP